MEFVIHLLKISKIVIFVRKKPTLKLLLSEQCKIIGASMYLRIIKVRTLSKYQYQYFNRKCNTVAPSN